MTFVLLTYNQEEYVADAIASVFAQDYDCLQIIVSDDCSTDNTFNIIKSRAELYSGPHEVIVRKNEKNIGIGAHISRVNDLAEGELVVVGAGDDISLEHRVSTIASAWLERNKRPGLIHSGCFLIDQDGKDLGKQSCTWLELFDSPYVIANKNSFVIGATEAWDRIMFSSFGAFRDELVHEDRALPFRTALADRQILYIDEALVKYRQNVGVSSHYNKSNRSLLTRGQRRVVLGRLLIDYMQKKDDLNISNYCNEKLLGLLENRIVKYEVSLALETGRRLSSVVVFRLMRTDPIYSIRLLAKYIVNSVRDAWFGWR